MRPGYIFAFEVILAMMADIFRVHTPARMRDHPLTPMTDEEPPVPLDAQQLDELRRQFGAAW